MLVFFFIGAELMWKKCGGNATLLKLVGRDSYLLCAFFKWWTGILRYI